MKRILSVLVVLLVAGVAPAMTSVSFTVSAGKHDRKNEPVCVPILLGEKMSATAAVAIKDQKGSVIAVGQLTYPDLLTESIPAESRSRRFDLHFVLPRLEAGKSLDLVAEINEKDGKPGAEDFSFVSEGTDKEQWTELRQGGRPVWRYMHTPWSGPAKDTGNPTSKVFHHVYDPSGKVKLTNGAEGKFPHHRGVFYGFSRTNYGKNNVDIWHCRGETHQAHVGFSNIATGPVLGRHIVEIAWNGTGKKRFATEKRELTAYRLPGGLLLEFVSKLTPSSEPIKLDGDPQHAGFHFRASQQVESKNEKQTIFVRPDGVDKPGATRNWDGKKNTSHVNLPWLAMSFVVDGKRYTCAYLDRPDNPKESRFSERAYGRFGSYFVTTVTKEKPLVVRYRLWIQEGQMTPEEVKALSVPFLDPLTVKLKKQ